MGTDSRVLEAGLRKVVVLRLEIELASRQSSLGVNPLPEPVEKQSSSFEVIGKFAHLLLSCLQSAGHTASPS